MSRDERDPEWVVCETIHFNFSPRSLNSLFSKSAKERYAGNVLIF